LEDLHGLLKEQLNAPRLGELAVLQNLISENDLNKAMQIQKSPRILGEILCDMGVINPLDLHYLLNKYKKQLKLGDILLKLGYIDKENLNNAIREQKQGSDSLGEILVRKKLITSEQLQEALSKQSNLPFKTLEVFTYRDEDKRILTGIIGRKFAEKSLILPISLVGKELTLALLRPENLSAVGELKELYNYLNLSCILITPEKFSELFEVLYSKKLGLTKSTEKPAESKDPVSQGVDFMQIELDEDMTIDEQAAPSCDAQNIEAEELVNFIIKYGISNGGSDIHLEQDGVGVKLRYRIDGVLSDVNIGWLGDKLQEKVGSVISRIKTISNLDIEERRLPQDGVFRINYYDKAKGQQADMDFRVATCKGIAGENVVIRIRDARKANGGLENLNHSPHVLEAFNPLIKRSAGTILVTGPTGSGKSSTLYGALEYIHNPTIKIITAEDPVKHSFPGILQTQINPRIDLTFPRLLRSVLRLDPDVILVGDIRDQETARIGFDAAQTGRLVLSALHTHDSVSSISRLLDLEIERAQIASCLTGVLAQRLVRKICPVCVQEYIPEERERVWLFDEYPSHLKFYKGKGCDSCGHTGYKGRTLLSEVFVVDKAIANALGHGADVEELKNLALDSGMKTMVDDGLLKLKETTLSEIVRVLPHDMIETFQQRNMKGHASKSNTGAEIQAKITMQGSEAGSFRISDPKKEHVLIEQMHQRYESLASQMDLDNKKIEQSLFEGFIAESFQEVCNAYQCKRVIYNIESSDGRIDISAVPV
jgi:type IV pilus assembly protein PilB